MSNYIYCLCDPTEETRKKIGERSKFINLGKKFSLETREKQRLARMGKIPGNKGKILSDEEKRKIRERSTCSKGVFQFSLDGNIIKRWISVRFASNSLGIARDGIIKACAGKSSHAGGFLWKYA